MIATVSSALDLDQIAATVGTFRLGPMSLSVPPGTTLAVLGPSGSGKSTLLRTIAGFQSAEGGAIRFGGEDLRFREPAERRIGYVFQTYALFPNLTTGGNIEFPMRMRNLDRSDIGRRVSEIADELGIAADYLPRDVDQLPEGIKQLAAIGRERAHLFDLLILDEPMSQMDSFIRKHMRVFLRELVRSFGKTTVVALTDPEDALSMGDSIAVTDRGELVEQGPAGEVYAHPRHRVTMEMLSPLGLNALAVDVDVDTGRLQPYDLPVPPAGSPLPPGTPLDGAGPGTGQRHLCFRPEETRLVADGGIVGRVTGSSFLDGRRELLQLEVHGESVTVVAPIGTDGVWSRRDREVRFVPTNPALF